MQHSRNGNTRLGSKRCGLHGPVLHKQCPSSWLATRGDSRSPSWLATRGDSRSPSWVATGASRHPFTARILEIRTQHYRSKSQNPHAAHYLESTIRNPQQIPTSRKTSMSYADSETQQGQGDGNGRVVCYQAEQTSSVSASTGFLWQLLTTF